MFSRSRSAFTLIELLVVIAIIAILAVVVILTLNPAQLLKESHDANRLSDAATIKNALGIYSEDVGGSLGSSSVVYVSIPDPLATTTAGDQCQGLGLPAAASDTYQCASSSTYRNVNSAGWIPVNLKNISFGSPINSYPVDPVNNSSSGEFYTYETNGTLYEITMALESTKYATIEASDGGPHTDLYEQGTSLTLAPVDFYALTGGSGGGGATSSFNGFSYERAITVSANTSIASGTNANFPMLISGAYSWLKPVSAGGRIQNLTTAPNGGTEPADLTFSVSSACTSPLDFETESYTSSTGNIIDWVNVPTMQAGTVIYACYGDTGVATDQSHPSLTWNTNYMFVQHMASGSIDSTANANNGADTAMTYNSGNGYIGQGAGFNGSNSQINDGTNNTDFVPSQMTFSAWVNYSSLQTYTSVESYEDSASGHTLLVKSNGKLAVYISGGSSDNYDGSGLYTLSPNTWYYLAYTYNNSTKALIGYVNGAVDASVVGSYSIGTPSGAQELIGNSHFSSRYWNGSIDEARFSNVVYSPSWIFTEYNNQSSPSTFYSVGSEL